MQESEINKVKFEGYTPDTIVQSIINKFYKRAQFGEKKYGVTLDRDDLNLVEWVEHIQDELQDAILYLEKLKKVFKENV